MCAAANQLVENYYQALWLAINPNTQTYGLGEAMVEAGKVLGYVTPAASVALLHHFRRKAGVGGPGLRFSSRVYSHPLDIWEPGLRSHIPLPPSVCIRSGFRNNCIQEY